MIKRKICITGVNGFVGKKLYDTLTNLNIHVVAIGRNLNNLSIKANVDYVEIQDLESENNLVNYLSGCDFIIHCAGKAYNKKLKADDYIKANLEVTKNLARHAVKAGVRKIVFLSSIKIHGEYTCDNYDTTSKNYFNKRAFIYDDKPDPVNSYAISKLKAEKALWEISSRTGLEVVVVRLPLVYGYDVKGNLARLIKLVKSGIPLPFSLVKNQRSMIGIDNLVDLLIRCIDHPEASGKTFLASDGEDLSTLELIKLIALSMKKKANLFPFPISMLKFLASVLRKREEINRLVGSLRVDDIYTKEKLNWAPPISVEEGIRRMVQGK
jgi:nucleoside-diphosphate-sugar epimerase